jgi:hypothetical protein
MRGAETQNNQTARRRPTLLRLWMSRTEPPFIGKVGSADILPVAAHAFSHEPVFLQLFRFAAVRRSRRRTRSFNDTNRGGTIHDLDTTKIL